MGNGLVVRESYRLEQWRGWISERQRSGRSVKEFCAEVGLNPDSYYYYLRKIRNQIAEEPTIFSMDFQETPTASRPLVLHYCGATIELDTRDQAALRVVLEALKSL